MKIMILVMIIGIVIGSMWNSVPIISQLAHIILDPTVGRLLNWNINLGMITITFMITLIITLLHKYTTDQETLRKIKAEQKILQKEMQKYKNHPEKLLEFQKKQFEFIPKTFDITMKPLIYTSIPIILFFRWFSDYFSNIGEFKFFGFFNWFWFYLILTIFFSSVLRKVLKVA